MEALKKSEFHERKCTVLLGEDRTHWNKTLVYRRVENNAKHLKWECLPEIRRENFQNIFFFFTFKLRLFATKTIQAAQRNRQELWRQDGRFNANGEDDEPEEEEDLHQGGWVPPPKDLGPEDSVIRGELYTMVNRWVEGVP